MLAHTNTHAPARPRFPTPTLLQVRYERDIIYTFISDILIAVNPFKQLPIYGTSA